MKITPERFATIMEAYGTQPERWPADERAAVAEYLAHNSQALSLIADYRMLDELLDDYRMAPMPDLESRVLNRVRNIAGGNAFDRLMDWLLPHSGRVLAWVWRPAMVACLPLVCGIFLANYFTFGVDGTQNSWEEELYLLSLNDYAETVE